MEKFYKLWQDIKAKLKQNYNRETYLSTFEKINDIHKVDDDKVYLIVPDKLHKEKFETLHRNKINNMALRLYNDKIEFIAITPDEIKDEKNLTKKRKEESIPDYGATNLNNDYTFANYIGGGSNDFAIKVALEVANNPGKAHNPFYIFGGVGLGKTHLMQAIGNKILENNPKAKIIYIDSNSLIQDFVYCAQNNMYTAFDKKYQNVDVLLIDDIQMLGRADSTQGAFFKIFNYLKENDKQIVITSDSHPKDLKNIMDRLTSRFADDVLANIAVPDLDQRVKILKHELAANISYSTYPEVPLNCIQFIAENFKTNVREIKGALKTTMLYCKMKGQFTLPLFKEALKSHLASRKTTESLTENSYDRIISTVSAFYNVSVSDVLGQSRKEKFTLPRHIAMYVIKMDYDLPYTKIGEIFGGRDHSTITSAIAKIEASLTHDIELAQAINAIRRKIS